MKTRLQSIALTLAATALLGSCSRPVATFQPSKAERFYTAQTPTPAVAEAEVAVTNSAGNVPTPAGDVPAAAATPTMAQASGALASLRATHAADRRLSRRIDKAQTMLAEVNQKLTQQTGAAVNQPLSGRKASIAERMALNSLDKKIRKHVAPEEKQALTRYVRLGLIIAAIGLILLLIGSSVGALLGLIGLVGGLVLVIIGLLQE